MGLGSLSWPSDHFLKEDLMAQKSLIGLPRNKEIP